MNRRHWRQYRLLVIAGLALVFAGWRWGDMVFAQLTVSEAIQQRLGAATMEDNRSYRDYLVYVQSILPSAGRQQISRNELEQLNSALLKRLEPLMGEMIDRARENAYERVYERFDVARAKQEAMRAEIDERIRLLSQKPPAEQIPWGMFIDEMKAAKTGDRLAAQPQYHPDYRTRRVVETLGDAYRLLDPETAKGMTADQYRRIICDEMVANGIDTRTATWSDFTRLLNRIAMTHTARLLRGKGIDIAGMNAVFGPLTVIGFFPGCERISTPEPLAAAPPSQNLPDRLIIYLTNRRSIDGYLLPGTTFGKDPATHIGIRPAGCVKPGVFWDAMVCSRREIARVEWYDETLREVISYSLEEYLAARTIATGD